MVAHTANITMNQFVLPFAFAALAVGLFFSYTEPAYQALQAFEEQQLRVEEVLQKARSLTNRVDTLTRQKAAIPQADLEQLNRYILPDNVDVVQSIIHFDNLARRSGVQLRSFSFPRITPGQGAAEDGVSEAVFTLDCVSTYERFKSFLKALETSALLADVTSLRVDVAPEVDTEEAGSAQTPATAQVYTVSLTTYWMP